jgi:hypothetical protein
MTTLHNSPEMWSFLTSEQFKRLRYYKYFLMISNLNIAGFAINVQNINFFKMIIDLAFKN